MVRQCLWVSMFYPYTFFESLLPANGTTTTFNLLAQQSIQHAKRILAVGRRTSCSAGNILQEHKNGHGQHNKGRCNGQHPGWWSASTDVPPQMQHLPASIHHKSSNALGDMGVKHWVTPMAKSNRSILEAGWQCKAEGR